MLLIGSSTGGPQALMALVAELGPVIDRFPVLITQHMPPTFTTILAEHLARASGKPAAEAVDSEPVKPGRIYLAPGGKHMRVVRRAQTRRSRSTTVLPSISASPRSIRCSPPPSTSGTVTSSR